MTETKNITPIDKLSELRTRGINLIADEQTHLPKVTTSSEFENALNQVTAKVNKSKDVLTMDIASLSDDELDGVIKQIEDAQATKRYVEESTSQLKKFLTNYSDYIVAQLTTRLNQAGLNELTAIDTKAKQLKKDLYARRTNQRWEEIREVFNVALSMYPRIIEYLPRLADFDNFRLRHPELASGAKSDKLTDKKRAIVNDELFQLNERITDLIALDNDPTFNSRYIIAIVEAFENNPTNDTYYQAVATARQKIADDLKREQDERARQEALQKLVLENQRLQAQHDALDTNSKTNEWNVTQQAQGARKAEQRMQHFLEQQRQAAAEKAAMQDNCRAWLQQFVSVNSLRFNSVAKDQTVAGNLIFELSHQLDQPSSDFSQFINNDLAKFFVVIQTITALYPPLR